MNSNSINTEASAVDSDFPPPPVAASGSIEDNTNVNVDANDDGNANEDDNANEDGNASNANEDNPAAVENLFDNLPGLNAVPTDGVEENTLLVEQNYVSVHIPPLAQSLIHLAEICSPSTSAVNNDQQTSHHDQQTSHHNQQTSHHDQHHDQQTTHHDQQTTHPDQQTTHPDQQTPYNDQQTSLQETRLEQNVTTIGTAKQCMFIPERIPLVSDLYKFCAQYKIDISDSYGHGKRLSRVEIIGRVYQFFLDWHNADGTKIEDSDCYKQMWRRTEANSGASEMVQQDNASIVVANEAKIGLITPAITLPRRSHKKFLDKNEAHRRFRTQGYYFHAATGELHCICNDRPVALKSDGDHKLHFAGKRHKNGIANKKLKAKLARNSKSGSKNLVAKNINEKNVVSAATEVKDSTDKNVNGTGAATTSSPPSFDAKRKYDEVSTIVDTNSTDANSLIGINTCIIKPALPQLESSIVAVPVRRKVGRPKGSTKKNKKDKHPNSINDTTGSNNTANNFNGNQETPIKNKKKKNLTAEEAYAKFKDYGYYLGEHDRRLRCSCNHKIIREKDTSDHNRHFLTSKHKKNVGKSPNISGARVSHENNTNNGDRAKKKRKTMLTKEEALVKFKDRGYYICSAGELRCSCNNKILSEKDETDHLRHILTQRHQDGLLRSENLKKLGLDPLVVMAGGGGGGDGDGNDESPKKRRKNFLKKEEALQLFMKKGYYLDDDGELRCACNNKLVSEKDETDHLRHFFTEKHKKMMLLRSKMRTRKTFLSHEQALQKFPSMGYYFDTDHVLRCACNDKIVSLKKDANAHKCHFNSKRHRKFMEERAGNTTQDGQEQENEEISTVENMEGVEESLVSL